MVIAGYLSARNEAFFVMAPDNTNDDNDQQLERLLWLQATQRELKPLPNTPAEHYLCHQRHLPKLPPTDVLGYWEARSALVGIARDNDGDLVAMQVVYLDHNASKIRKETRGFPKITAVRLPSRTNEQKTIIFCEGLETAMSIWVAVGYEVEVWAVGGKNFLRYAEPPSETQRIILFADNDDDANDGGVKSRAFYDYVARLLSTKTRVLIARPEQTGWDANDVFRHFPHQQAITEIRQIIVNSFQGDNNYGYGRIATKNK